MFTCPDDLELQQLVNEQLDAADESRIVLHVEGCERCQERLNVLCGRDLDLTWLSHSPSVSGSWSLLPAHLVPDGPDPAGDPAGTVTRRETGDKSMADRVSHDDLSAPPRPDSQRTLDPEDTLETGLVPARDVAATTDAIMDVVPITGVDAGLAGPTNPGGEGSSGAVVQRDSGETVTEGGPCEPLPIEGQGRSGVERPMIPGYEVLSMIGQGGMGVVYKARQLGLNRLVALKMIIGGGQARAELVTRFRVEAEAIARLRHPNIMEIYEIGEVVGSPFVSLELLEGGDLDDRLAGTPQPGAMAADLASTLARAVQAAHEARIIHRDLKPANVLFTAAGVPKITDFGLAKRLESDSKQTETGQIMGSPSYMAPEQARGHTRDVGPAADVYALGAILYQMLTGRPPFRGETPMETIRQVIDDDPVPPSRLVPRMARDLETICLKCLSKAPEKRYDSARELADDLDRYRHGDTIRARPTPAWERGIKWARRRPVIAMVMVLSLAVVLGLTTWGSARERAERHRIVQLDERYFLDESHGLMLCDQAEKAVSGGSRADLEKALGELGTFHPDVDSDLRLKLIRDRTDAKRRAIAARLRDLGSMEAAREQFRRFLGLRQEAQFYAAGFDVLAPADRARRLRDAGHEALRVYAANPRAGGDAWSLADPLPTSLTETERVAIRDGCYDLLLILSQGADAREGLRILDQAARLRPAITAAYHLRRADCLDRAGDPAGRDRERALARKSSPITALDEFLTGRELAVSGRFAEAIGPLERAVQRDLDQTSAHLLLAACYLKGHPPQLSAARTSLNVCIRSHADVVGLYLIRALIHGAEAQQAAGAEASAAVEAAEADYRHALELAPGDDLRYDLLANRGLLRLQSDRIDAAATDLNTAIAINPLRYQAHTTLGQVLHRQGRLDEAAASFGRAIACRPAPDVLAGLHRTRALLMAAGAGLTDAQRAAALADLAESIGLDPDPVLRAGDNVWRARLFFRAGRSREALAECDSALKLAPRESEAHRVRISALMDLKRYDDVLAAVDVYLERGKPIAEILEIRGLARLERHDHAGAIADFNRALDLVPAANRAGRRRVLNRRGWAYQYADAPRLALADFEESLRLEPAQGEAYGGRGLALIRLGRWREAVADAVTAVSHARTGGAGAGATGQEAADLQVQALFNAARIHALAMEYAAREVSRQGERALSLHRGYRSRALGLLQEVLERTPDPARRAEMLADPAMRPLRLGTSRSPDLTRSP